MANPATARDPETKEKLEWRTVDISTLPPTAAAAYKKYIASQQEAKQAQKVFEDVLTKHLTTKRKVPDGMVARYGYLWGKLSIAFQAADKAPGAKKGEGMFSLA